MSERTALLEPQFDRLEQQREASSIGMWAFLASEILFFGTLFAGYAVYRTLFPEAFHEGSRMLVWPAGAVNTAVLLTSSLTMALAVRATRTGSRSGALLFLLATVFFGAVFLGIKGWEYADEFHKGHVPVGLGSLFGWAGTEGPDAPRTDLFLTFYFIMTGFHALHMVVGLGLMLWMAWTVLRSPIERAAGPVEMTGLYWHFVDVVWIFLFPMLYLLGLD